MNRFWAEEGRCLTYLPWTARPRKSCPAFSLLPALRLQSPSPGMLRAPCVLLTQGLGLTLWSAWKAPLLGLGQFLLILQASEVASLAIPPLPPQHRLQVPLVLS